MCLDSAASQGICSLPFCVCMPRVQAALKVSASSVVTLGMGWVSPDPLVVTYVPVRAARSQLAAEVSNNHGIGKEPRLPPSLLCCRELGAHLLCDFSLPTERFSQSL